MEQLIVDFKKDAKAKQLVLTENSGKERSGIYEFVAKQQLYARKEKPNKIYIQKVPFTLQHEVTLDEPLFALFADLESLHFPTLTQRHLFEHYLGRHALMNPDLISQRWPLFVDSVKAQGGIQNYRHLIGSVTHKAVEFIAKLNLDVVQEKMGKLEGAVYSKANCNKQLVSIDVKEANYQTLFMMRPDVFPPMWSAFLHSFTADTYLPGCKVLRQRIIGQAVYPPALMRAMEHYLMLPLDACLKAQKVQIVARLADEIVIADTGAKLELPKTGLYRQEYFVLSSLSQRLPYFSKTFADGRIQLKGVAATHLMQIICQVHQAPVLDYDLYVRSASTNEVAQLVEPSTF